MQILKKIKRLIKPKKFFTNSMKKYKKYNIGDFTYGKPNIFSPPEKIKIGKYCSIAGGVTIYTSTDHNMNNVSVYPFFMVDKKSKYEIFSKGGVAIENDVWIGDGAVILDGVKIGNGAIIGARSVVTKDVKPYEVVAGNPARHIRFRFDEKTVSKLLEIAWWDWDKNKVKQYAPLLANDSIEEFIQRIEEEGK